MHITIYYNAPVPALKPVVESGDCSGGFVGFICALPVVVLCGNVVPVFGGCVGGLVTVLPVLGGLVVEGSGWKYRPAKKIYNRVKLFKNRLTNGTTENKC